MDLDAAKLADQRAVRLSRAGMLACFVIACVMLIASLAMAKGFAPPMPDGGLLQLATQY